LAFRRGRVRLLSRNNLDMGRYPEVIEALGGQPADDFVVDGEVVAFSGRQTSFSRLQGRGQGARVPIFFYAFDILHLDGFDLTRLPLRRRKVLLRRALSFGDPLRFLPHRAEHGERYQREACQKGWEGIIAKRASAPYTSGRSGDWLKMKCVADQELVIGGFTDPRAPGPGPGPCWSATSRTANSPTPARWAPGTTRRCLGPPGRAEPAGLGRLPFAETARTDGACVHLLVHAS